MQHIEIVTNGWQKYEAVPVAQWIARWTSNPKVAGSNPAGDSTTIFLPLTLEIREYSWPFYDKSNQLKILNVRIIACNIIKIL